MFTGLQYNFTRTTISRFIFIVYFELYINLPKCYKFNIVSYDVYEYEQGISSTIGQTDL